MDEDKIKSIFSAYDPELSSSFDFMERLEGNLDSIELIHRENDAVMRRNRLAVLAASCAGFLTGVIFTLLSPYITSLMHTLTDTFLTELRLPQPMDYIQVATWLIIGGVSVFVALNTYSITLSLPLSRGGRREAPRP